MLKLLLLESTDKNKRVTQIINNFLDKHNFNSLNNVRFISYPEFTDEIEQIAYTFHNYIKAQYAIKYWHVNLNKILDSSYNYDNVIIKIFEKNYKHFYMSYL